MKISDRALLEVTATLAVIYGLMSFATWGFDRAGWLADAPPSCATYWAAHRDQDAHAYNREHHIRATCTP